MQNFRRIDAWRKAHALLLNIDRFLRRIPRPYSNLASQLRRSAESVPNNIVEGCGFESQREFAKYLQNSISSANEVEYQLQQARDYGLLSRAEWSWMTADIVEVRKMTIGLARKVRRDADQQDEEKRRKKARAPKRP